MQNPALKYRADIDGLRAVAVLSVIVFHAFPSALPGGFLGVDIFFVISGFLIFSIIYQNLQSGNFSITDFYQRRIRRIFPALLTILIATLAAGYYVFLPDEMQLLGKHTLGATTFPPTLCCGMNRAILTKATTLSHSCICGLWRWKSSFIWWSPCCFGLCGGAYLCGWC